MLVALPMAVHKRWADLLGCWAIGLSLVGGGMFTLCHYKSTNAFVTPKNQMGCLKIQTSILDSKKQRKKKGLQLISFIHNTYNFIHSSQWLPCHITSSDNLLPSFSQLSRPMLYFTGKPVLYWYVLSLHTRLILVCPMPLFG